MSPNNCDDCGHDRSMCECPKEDLQIGGSHYKANYQHWDWAVDVRLGYLESAATKYVFRWYKKNGLEDLDKAKSYLLKVRDCYLSGRWFNTCLHVDTYPIARDKANNMFAIFVDEAEVPTVEADLCLRIANWKTSSDLNILIRDLMTHREAAGLHYLKYATLAPLTYAAQRTVEKQGGSGHVGGATTKATASGTSTDLINHPSPFGYTPLDDEKMRFYVVSEYPFVCYYTRGGRLLGGKMFTNGRIEVNNEED